MIKYEDFNIGRVAREHDVKGKLILFKDNNQAYTMYAEIKQNSEYIHVKSKLEEYLNMISEGTSEDYIYGSGLVGNVKLFTIQYNTPITYPFVFIPFNLLNIHKITGFVELDSNISIECSNSGSNLQDIRFVPVSKDGILYELSNEL